MLVDIGILLFGLLLGIWLFWRLPDLSLTSPASLAAAPVRRISLIIPARNEAQNISLLLSSIGDAGLSFFECIVVNDASTDDTARIARDCGAIVLDAPPLPQGWLGKPWACHVGAQAATGEWLLFLDADVRFHPDSFMALNALAKTDMDVLSIEPYHQMQRFYERLSAFCLAIVIGSMGAKSRHTKGGYGPVLYVRADIYKSVGGHSSVHHALLENHDLCNHLQGAGAAVKLRLGRPSLTFRMYPGGLCDFVRGWRKTLAAGAGSTSVVRLIATSVWLAASLTFLTVPASLSQGATLPLFLLVVFYLLYAVQMRYILRQIGNYGLLPVVLHPLYALVFVLIFLWSLVSAVLFRQVTWKDRAISTNRRRS